MLTARLFLYDRVNRHLWGQVSPQFRAERGPSAALVLVPRTLLAAVYMHFAQELAGRTAPGTPCKNSRCDQAVDPAYGRLYCDDRCRDQARECRDRLKKRAGTTGKTDLAH
jgi:hypothetical protein